jgi:ABC-type polysaccharide/polyol phosphate transport system ATPase subunit
VISAPVVSLTDVSLWRRTQEELHYDLKRFVFAVLKGTRKKPQRRMVLDGVRLTVGAGEKIGILGANGSGKSTLLKVICGILEPTSGKVAVNGSIAPLIELGAGFDPELSLTDNIIYYGMLLGVDRRRMRAHLDPILDFAELHEYRNEPVKTLSSGMTARLGFAIATEFRPDILILDEVLSVGDESFKRKCTDRIGTLWDEHSTIIVVSHDLDFITHNCSRAIWLEKGVVKYDGRPFEAVLRYRIAVEEHRLAGVDSDLPTVLLCAAGSDSRYADRVYAYINGTKHWVNDERWLEVHGLELGDALPFEDAVLDGIPEGPPMQLDSAALR